MGQYLGIVVGVSPGLEFQLDSVKKTRKFSSRISVGCGAFVAAETYWLLQRTLIEHNMHRHNINLNIYSIQHRDVLERDQVLGQMQLHHARNSITIQLYGDLP